MDVTRNTNPLITMRLSENKGNTSLLSDKSENLRMKEARRPMLVHLVAARALNKRVRLASSTRAMVVLSLPVTEQLEESPAPPLSRRDLAIGGSDRVSPQDLAGLTGCTYSALPLIRQVAGAPTDRSQDLQDLGELMSKQNVPKGVGVR
ncbi:hypothetical protein N8I77_012165 [Diaporthe amygdali]|uniref:Uncharacterized protein n=1 Tax=Phomopsis amygdali TaxID=1214568 RepID=A0AAD9S4E0_PHOAM|nr:hypothetical protein N8I77_012165 [Diaporthe amygdali]